MQSKWASSWPASHQSSRPDVYSHTRQPSPRASAFERGRAHVHRQQAAAILTEMGPRNTMHVQSAWQASEAGRRGRCTTVQARAPGASFERGRRFMGGMQSHSESASVGSAGASLSGSEPEPHTSEDSNSGKQGAQASQKVDAESRISEWQQRSGIDVDHRPPWGTFIKGVGLVVLWLRELGKSIKAPLAVLRELTYPDTRGILRLTFIVLAASAVLTALVWSIDRTFATLLLPPVARKLNRGAILKWP